MQIEFGFLTPNVPGVIVSRWVMAQKLHPIINSKQRPSEAGKSHFSSYFSAIQRYTSRRLPTRTTRMRKAPSSLLQMIR